MMTRKHFEALAAFVKDTVAPSLNLTQLEVVAEKLADFCAEQNPRFDRPKFLEACGVYEVTQ